MGGFGGLSQGLNSTDGTAGAADQGGVGGAPSGWRRWRRWWRGLLRRRRRRRWDAQAAGRRGWLVVRCARRDGVMHEQGVKAERRFCDDFVVDGDAV